MLCIKRDGRIFARCNDIVELAEKIHKKAIFLLIGSNPHPNILSDEWISNTERAKNGRMEKSVSSNKNNK